MSYQDVSALLKYRDLEIQSGWEFSQEQMVNILYHPDMASCSVCGTEEKSEDIWISSPL